MKEVRKTSNIIIRDKPKRMSRQQLPDLKNKTALSTGSQQKKWTARHENIELQKQITKAENLTEEETAQIHKEARKTVTKKIRNEETKMENEMIACLEQECNKLGAEVEKKEHENAKLKVEVGELRKNIDFLNRKLENIYKDHEHLSKNNDYGQMQKQEMKEEILKLKSVIKRKDDEAEFNRMKLEDELEGQRREVQKLRERSEKYEKECIRVMEEKEETEEYLEEKTKECQYLRENFEEKKKEWDRLRQGFQTNTRQNLDKKAEKIAKTQGHLQTVQDKLKEEESVRKKVAEKNKDLERELGKKSECISGLEEQIVQLKKRVNDLAILKSSNNTILSQKIQKLEEENERLKKQVQQGRRGSGTNKKQDFEQSQSGSKPYLFGPMDEDD